MSDDDYICLFSLNFIVWGCLFFLYLKCFDFLVIVFFAWVMWCTQEKERVQHNLEVLFQLSPALFKSELFLNNCWNIEHHNLYLFCMNFCMTVDRCWMAARWFLYPIYTSYLITFLIVIIRYSLYYSLYTHFIGYMEAHKRFSPI